MAFLGHTTLGLAHANKIFKEDQFGTAGHLYKKIYQRHPQLKSVLFGNWLITKKRAAKYYHRLCVNSHSTLSSSFLVFGLRLLFILPGPFESNNGYHVQLYARKLEKCGVSCVFAIPDKFYNEKDFGAYPYSFLRDNHSEPFDIIHVWTPRERVRKFCEDIVKYHKCPVVVHLEDNEEYLTEVASGYDFADLKKMTNDMLDDIISENCFHPVKGRNFLANASALTIIINTLKNFAIEGQSILELPCPVDEQLFFPRSLNVELRHSWEILDNSLVFVYTGNVHAGNYKEVLELYRAVKLLNESGHKTILLRTGINASNISGEDWNSPYVKMLGWVKRKNIPEILAAADILIQPGEPDAFNNQRVPSKLPEFFSIGRPIILPKTNIGLSVRHKKDGYVLEKADAMGIFNAVIDIVQSKDLKTQLSRGSVDFYKKKFCSDNATVALLNLYFTLISIH